MESCSLLVSPALQVRKNRGRRNEATSQSACATESDTVLREGAEREEEERMGWGGRGRDWGKVWILLHIVSALYL